MNYQIEIENNGKKIKTLADILPNKSPIKMLIIGKVPAHISVSAGHYYQGRQGTMFWNKLKDYGLLKYPSGQFEDETLIDHGYGITDIVKIPRDYRDEPTNQEYKDGWVRVDLLLIQLQPKLILFVYKKPLDKVLNIFYNRWEKTKYGLNSDLEELFQAKVFVFPMPGTPCNSEEAHTAMTELQNFLQLN